MIQTLAIPPSDACRRLRRAAHRHHGADQRPRQPRGRSRPQIPLRVERRRRRNWIAAARPRLDDRRPRADRRRRGARAASSPTPPTTTASRWPRTTRARPPRWARRRPSPPAPAPKSRRPARPAAPTRTCAPPSTPTYLGACRGIELVNNPDKGNQNVFAPGRPAAASPISADGDKVLWSVTGGAPGGAQRHRQHLPRRSAAPAAGTRRASPRRPKSRSAAATSPTSSPRRRPTSAPSSSSATGSTGLASPTAADLRAGARRANRTSSRPTRCRRRTGTESSRRPERRRRARVRPRRADRAAGGHRRGPGRPARSPRRGRQPDARRLALASAAWTSTTGQSFPGVQSAATIGHPGDHWIATTDASRVYFRARPNGNCSGAYGLYVRNREAGQRPTLIDPGRNPEFITRHPRRPPGLLRHHSTRPRPRRHRHRQRRRLPLGRGRRRGGESSCLTCVAAEARRTWPRSAAARPAS